MHQIWEKKCFPLVLRHSNFEKGINTFSSIFTVLIRKLQAIAPETLGKLKAFDLSLEKLAAADNANVNYGKQNSVYQKLKNAKEDKTAANCLAYILHNAVEYATGKLDADVEHLFLKVYSHFSISATRT